MSYKYLAGLAIMTAQYATSVERRAKLPCGAWGVGAGAFFHYELLENYRAMLDADPVAIHRYKEIASFVCVVPLDCIDERSRCEIESMLRAARKVGIEYSSRFNRDRSLVDIMRTAAVSIAKNLHHMKTAGA